VNPIAVIKIVNKFSLFMLITVRFLIVFLFWGLACSPRVALAQRLDSLLANEFAQWENDAKAAKIDPNLIAEVLKFKNYDVSKQASLIWDEAERLGKSYPAKTSLKQLLTQIKERVPRAGGSSGTQLSTQAMAELQRKFMAGLSPAIKDALPNQSAPLSELPKDLNAAWEKNLAQQKQEASSWNMYLIGMGIIAIVASLLAYWLGTQRKPHRRPDDDLATKYQQQKELSQRLQAELGQVKTDKQQLEAQWAEQKTRLEARITALERPPVPEKESVAVPVAHPVEPPAIFYAKFADRENPLGFTLRNLSQQIDEEKVFMITVLSETAAEYRIVDSYEAFVKANQIMAYFKEACSFDQSPTTANQRIETMLPGKLTKTRDSWEIVGKAKVRFV